MACRRPAWWAWLGALLLVLVGARPAQARPVPALAGHRVVDEAGVLSAAQARALERRLAAYEASTGRQLAVLTVDSLQGDPIEDFSIRVVEAWALGRKGHDDGLLVVLAMQERRVRIEVGYGLEGEVTDLISSRIIHDVMRPRLRRGQPGEALSAGVEALMAAAGAPQAPPSAEAEAPSFWTERYYGHPGFWYVLVSVTVVAVFAMCLRWPLVGVIALLVFGRVWWPGTLVCVLALYIRWRLWRRRSLRNGYGVEQPRPRSSGGLGSWFWKLGGLVTLLGIGRMLTSGTGRGVARRIGGGGGLFGGGGGGSGGLFGGGGGSSGGFFGGGGGFGGGGASGGW